MAGIGNFVLSLSPKGVLEIIWNISPKILECLRCITVIVNQYLSSIASKDDDGNNIY